MARYVIGIDLGTTNSAVAYSDSESESQDIELLEIPQVVAAGEVANRKSLPSFLLMPSEHEMARGAMGLPWQDESDFCVGAFARSRGSELPHRIVSSAKSWLSYAGVDRSADILPWRGSDDPPEEEKQVSPVGASARYLQHLRAAWDSQMPEPMAEQEILLTVPASFDVVAKELTVAAAREAGLTNVTLLEEPQAAFYSWLAKNGDSWRGKLASGDLALVCDIGGGTSDFSLISANDDGEGNLTLERVAVGEHILLGGDNMDLALAFTVKAKLEAAGKKLAPWQVHGLTHACRTAKEALLSGQAESMPIVVPSRGRKLIGGSLRTELTRDEVNNVVLAGFFPEVEKNARPVTRARAALTQLGLPYAQDAAVTRHLAAFLARQLDAARDVEGFSVTEGASFMHPTAVLFNGGVLKASVIAERVTQVLNGWLAADGGAPARVLGGADLDGGVARGAAYYGYARSGGGVRIHGGLAQAFYVGVETAMPAVPGLEPEVHALCVAPFGLDEGSDLEPLHGELGLIVGEPVRFRFFASSVRRDDQLGTLLTHWDDEELQELGAIEAHLEGRGDDAQVVPVRLRARVTELGTLVLEALPTDGGAPYKVELDVRE